MEFRDLVAGIDRAIQDRLGGVDVIYAPRYGSSVTVSGMFDENYVPAEGAQGTVGTSTPAVHLRLEDLPEDPRSVRPNSISILGVEYSIRGHSTDGAQGKSVMLYLRKMS